MILIADGGSTKCDWLLLDKQGKQILKTRTKGLNPAVFKPHILEERLNENKDLAQLKESIERVDFFGAGCGTPTPAKVLHGILKEYFSSAYVNVDEDMVAAAYAATTEPGIVCILGTGSNSCYFDGQKVHMEVESDICALARRIMLMEEEAKKAEMNLANTVTKLAMSSKEADEVLKKVKVVENKCMNNEVQI